MKALVKHVEQGRTLETHDDVPDTIRDQLYAEERQQIEKRQKVPNPPPTGLMLPPINMNVGPTQSSRPLDSSHDHTEIASDQADLDIPVPIEV